MSGLLIKDLQVHHGAIRAVDGLSFSVEPGQIAAVIGANGAGKTTLLRSLTGLKLVHSGTATWNGISILKRKPEDLVRSGIVHVSDGNSVIPELTVQENLALGGIWRRDKKDVALATQEVLELFPRLAERMRQSADTLSGGERQMLAIGRALIARPTLLLLDEPSLGLAPLVIEQIFQAIKSLRDRLNLTVVLVEQNALSALRISDVGVIINLGRLVTIGPSRELIDNPALRAAYLGY
jgi:branched-chain amino acid transport system ATP-binding protein